jgi:hypothetical protein
MENCVWFSVFSDCSVVYLTYIQFLTFQDHPVCVEFSLVDSYKTISRFVCGFEMRCFVWIRNWAELLGLMAHQQYIIIFHFSPKNNLPSAINILSSCCLRNKPQSKAPAQSHQSTYQHADFSSGRFGLFPSYFYVKDKRAPPGKLRSSKLTNFPVMSKN